MRRSSASLATISPAIDPESATDAVPAGSAILRAIRVLETIAASAAPLQLADLCRALELPKPTVFRILSTLEHAGLVVREPGSKRYQCGSRLCALAGSVLLHSPMFATRHAILEELVEQTGETCNLTIPNGNTVMYLDRVETAWPLRIALSAGSSVPLFASASGKLFLAAMPRRTRDRLLRQSPMVRYTPKTLVEVPRLVAELDRVCEQGYATDDEEYLVGICCLAVPVRDADERTVAAVAMHAPISRLRLAEAMQFLPQLQAAAQAIAGTLDW